MCLSFQKFFIPFKILIFDYLFYKQLVEMQLFYSETKWEM